MFRCTARERDCVGNCPGGNRIERAFNSSLWILSKVLLATALHNVSFVKIMSFLVYPSYSLRRYVNFWRVQALNYCTQYQVYV